MARRSFPEKSFLSRPDEQEGKTKILPRFPRSARKQKLFGRAREQNENL